MVREESETLLHAGQPSTEVRRRSSALRVAVGIVGAATLIAGAVVAVELSHASPSSAPGVVPMVFQSAPQHHNAPAAPLMEAQFGWGTINNAWCTVRAATSCLFSSDKDKCKEEIHAKCDSKDDDDGDDDHSVGDGSGSSDGSGSDVGAPEVGHEANETSTTHRKKHKKHRKKHKKATPEPPAEEPAAASAPGDETPAPAPAL